MPKSLSIWLIFACAAFSPLSRGEEPTKPTPSANEKNPAVPAAGHSLHGEAFDDGPRQKAFLVPGQGNCVFKVTTKSEEAQKFINQGVSQIHSFFYLEAERSFRPDLVNHGGRDKAVYAYASEHYRSWQVKLGRELTPGNFGENLTTEGLLETGVCIGDEFRVGTARLVVTQPRMPCFKLGIRFGDSAMLKAFVKNGQPGIYFAIIEEGEVGPGDIIERVVEDVNKITVTEMFTWMIDRHAASRDDLQRVLNVKALAQVWREGFEHRLRS